MIREVQGESRKILRAALVAEQGTGKTTLVAEACIGRKAAIIDTEEGSGLIRDPKTKCYIVDTFDDVMEAYQMAVKAGYELIGIDSISPVWKSWVDYNSIKHGGKIPIYAWNMIKAPWRKFIRLVQTSHVSTIITSRIGYEMETSGDQWKVDKDKWTAQAEKDFLYEMDVVVKLYKDNGRYMGIIEKARTRKNDPILSKLVSTPIENLTFNKHIQPFIDAGNKGTIEEFTTSDAALDSGNQALDEKTENEAQAKKDEADMKKAVSSVVAREKKCAKAKIYGYLTDEQIASTRKTYLGNSNLAECSIESLRQYFAGMEKQIGISKEAEVGIGE